MSCVFLPNLAKTSSAELVFIVISCYQLLTADDRCYKKNLNEIFIYVLKMICMPYFSSLCWFLFLSAVNSCWQLLTPNDSCHKQNLNGIIIYPLKLIPVPNFSSLQLILIFINCYQLSSAVDSCWQLMTADMNKIWLEFSCTLYRRYLCQISAL